MTCPVNCDQFDKGEYCEHVGAEAAANERGLEWRDKDAQVHAKLATMFRREADPKYAPRTAHSSVARYGTQPMRARGERRSNGQWAGASARAFSEVARRSPK